MMKIGFIGTGNMGGALARAAARAEGTKLYLADRDEEKAALLAQELGGVVSGNREIAETCEMIFLGVKPQMMAGMLEEIAPVLAGRKDAVLVSMAAGLAAADVYEMAGKNCPVIRIMPNTPASVGEGVILYAPQPEVPEVKVLALQRVLEKAGMLDRIPENLIDAASAVSGCGPAFAFLFIEALADGGVSCGLPRDKALRYAQQMLLGSARLALETGRHPGELKDMVCSPGGTTIEGVRVLEDGAFRGSVMEAVAAAYRRTLELAGK